MKKFFLVFEDVLDTTQKRIISPIEAESEKALADQLGLQRLPPQGARERYFLGGEMAGIATIYICRSTDDKLENPDDLQKLCLQLRRDWY